MRQRIALLPLFAKRLAATLALAGFALATGACGEGNPCEKLTAQLCAAVDAELCAELKKAPVGDGQDATCAAVLGDDRKLAEYLAVAKSASDRRAAEPAAAEPATPAAE